MGICGAGSYRLFPGGWRRENCTGFQRFARGGDRRAQGFGKRAAFLGMPNVALETDAANLGKAITSEALDHSHLGGLFSQIRDLVYSSFNSVSVSVCPRVCNRLADSLAAYGVRALPDGGHVFGCQAPSFVTELVSGDLPDARG